MKKTYVEVDGLKFSREDAGDYLQRVKNTLEALTKAIEEYDKPEPVKHLDRVRNRFLGTRGVVLFGGTVQQRYVSTLNFSKGCYTVVHENGGGSTYNTEAELLDAWEVVE